MNVKMRSQVFKRCFLSFVFY